MCLNNPVKVRANSKTEIRYKVVVPILGRILSDGSTPDLLYTPWQNAAVNPHEWQYKVEPKYDIDSAGYHVYVDIRGAKRMVYPLNWSGRIVKIQVKHLVATGKFDGCKSEVWRTYKILKFVGTPDAKELNKKFGYKQSN